MALFPVSAPLTKIAISWSFFSFFRNALQDEADYAIWHSHLCDD